MDSEMTDIQDRQARARAVFAGLAPTPTASADASRDDAVHETGRFSRGVIATMPLVLAGAMTVSMNLTGPIEPANAQPKRPKPPTAQTPQPVIATAASIATAATPPPATYTVRAGDTVSGIAERYGLSTASVLTLNGLGWKSLIFPGQVLKLTKTAAAAPAPSRPATGAVRYVVRAGDTISRIAQRHGVSTQSVLSANRLGWSSIIYPGQTVVIPSAGGGPTLEGEPVAEVTPVTPSTYLVVSGDTISKIARQHGVSTQAVLDANRLTWSSVIYPGQRIVIPGTAPAGSTGGVTPLTSEMAGNARTIIDVGRSLGVSDRGIVIALAAAMQESSLRNIPYGDRDSVGLFQQRPSAGWGSVKALMDPVHASRLFYGGPSNPNRGVTRGLLEIPGWERMTVTQAAQAVQISAYPDAYAKWEASARAWLAQLG